LCIAQYRDHRPTKVRQPLTCVGDARARPFSRRRVFDFMGYEGWDYMPSSSLILEYDYVAVSLNDAGCGSQKEILFAKDFPKKRVGHTVIEKTDMGFCEYGGEQLGAGADPTDPSACFAGETEKAGTYLNPKPTSRTWAVYDLMLDIGLEVDETGRRHRIHGESELAWTGDRAWYDPHVTGFEDSKRTGISFGK